MKLTLAQEKALAELTHEWQSPYQLHARLSTLDALVARGLAVRRLEMGWRFFPRTNIFFKLAGERHE